MLTGPSRSRLLSVAALTRRFPGLRGIDRLTRWIHSPDRPPGSGIEGIVPYGQHSLFHVDTTNYLEWCVFFRGHYSQSISALIPFLLRPGMVALDIGANNGTETILMAEAVGKTGRVIAVEPNAPALTRLARNIELNRCRQVSVDDRCVGAHSGEAAFLIVSTTNNPTASTQIGSRPSETATTQIVEAGPLTTVDELLSRYSCQDVDLIKIDTDGTELDVLAGAVETLNRSHPHVIFECDPGNYQAHGNTWEQAYRLMSSLGYGLYGIVPKRQMCDLEPLTIEPPSVTDVLAVRTTARG